MLKPDFAFVQNITVERWIGRGISADEYSNPELLKCRVNFTQKIMYGNSNETKIAVGNVWLPAGTRIDVHDKVTFGGNAYKVLSCQPCYDIFGEENHVEVVIQ